MLVPLRNTAGETVSDVELLDNIFGIRPNVPVMHQALMRQHANARLGTHKTKKRAEVRGGGRKPWRQKGTGRARQGSIRAPQWKGGGTVFGPQPRSYRQKMNRKMRRLALKSALSAKVLEDQLLVLDDVQMDAPKTKDFVAMLDRLDVADSIFFVLADGNDNVELSARNVPYVKMGRADCLSVRDLLGYDYVVLTRDSVDVIHQTLAD
jgi:large subunit ribosomal protein L4